MDKKISAGDGGNSQLPPPGKGVHVINQGLELLAYRDGQGNWRDYYIGDVLSGEVRVVTLKQDRSDIGI